MAALKKGTKLTDKPKDYTIRVRVDREMLAMLDELCEKKGKTRSIVVRECIEEQYQKLKK